MYPWSSSSSESHQILLIDFQVYPLGLSLEFLPKESSVEALSSPGRQMGISL